jgi:hypothetical protein
MKPVVWMGAVIALLGVLGLVAPVFTTSQTKDVVNLGDLKIQSTDHSTHVVPEALSAAAVILGLLMLGAGVYRR